MKKLGRAEDIWTLEPSREDLQAGAAYAAITLPWTFNRLYKNTSSRGQRERGLNIAKGIVAQEALRRALESKGLAPEVQRKSHRRADLFDFRLPVLGRASKVDIKTVNHYSDYGAVGRAPFSPELVIENAEYAGPDWRRFFPMLLPHTQIHQDKEVYCFAIASSIDFRGDLDTDRLGYALTAYPYGPPMAFLSSKRLCLAREEAGRGVYLRCRYRHEEARFSASALSLTLVGEWEQKVKRETVEIKPGRAAAEAGPFSCVSSFQIARSDLDRLRGEVEVSVSRNDLEVPVSTTTRRNVNTVPEEKLVLRREDFCNLMLPASYRVYFLGWILKEEFLGLVGEYTGWVWPRDSEDRFKNQPWSQITPKDEKHLARAGFDDAIQETSGGLNAGWMKTHGRGGGACCYVFPNIGANGGVRENNLYVLPKDLYVMDELIPVPF